MPVKGHGTAVYENRLIALDNHTVIVARLRACAPVANASDRAAHHRRTVTAGHNRAAVARRISYANYATHYSLSNSACSIPHCST
ncbi:hypothetical protein PSP6_270039 [Paraburkholderia tropica]|nr:hypothetical protein PSP6_270039 [Paraburkholderia tropica]